MRLPPSPSAAGTASGCCSGTPKQVGCLGLGVTAVLAGLLAAGSAGGLAGAAVLAVLAFLALFPAQHHGQPRPSSEQPDYTLQGTSPIIDMQEQTTSAGPAKRLTQTALR